MSNYYPNAPSLEDQPNAQLSTKFFIVRNSLWQSYGFILIENEHIKLVTE